MSYSIEERTFGNMIRVEENANNYHNSLATTSVQNTNKFDQIESSETNPGTAVHVKDKSQNLMQQSSV